ncbi:MAG: cytochrome c maturation protein CcmE [Burkholderiaceae bacterium]
MKSRHKRALMILGGLSGLGIAVGLVMYALSSNLVFFYTPTQVADGEAPTGRAFKIGGLVQEGSVKREGTQVAFIVTDNARSMPVSYTGILPDLFKEGRGIVAEGKLQNGGQFVASKVLAKHDENYMPPEAAEALKRAGHPVGVPEQFIKKPTPGAD